MSLYLNNSPSTILSSFENLIVGTVGCDWAAAGSPFSSEHLLHIYSANWKSFVIPRSITLSIIQPKNCADCAASVPPMQTCGGGGSSHGRSFACSASNGVS